MWSSETKMLESGFEGRHLFDFRAGNGGIFSQIPWPWLTLTHLLFPHSPGPQAGQASELYLNSQASGDLCSLPVFVPLKDRALGQRWSTPEGARAPRPPHWDPQMWVCDLGSTPRPSSGFLSQGALGFQRERCSVVRLLRINERRGCEWREGLGWADTGLISPKEQLFLWSFQKAGPTGIWLVVGVGGRYVLKVLILPEDIHSFIIYSFNRNFLSSH